MKDDQAGRWATSEDFEKWRGTIIRLYMDENRDLKSVMEIMKEEYGFYAT